MLCNNCGGSRQNETDDFQSWENSWKFIPNSTFILPMKTPQTLLIRSIKRNEVFWGDSERLREISEKVIILKRKNKCVIFGQFFCKKVAKHKPLWRVGCKIVRLLSVRSVLTKVPTLLPSVSVKYFSFRHTKLVQLWESSLKSTLISESHDSLLAVTVSSCFEKQILKINSTHKRTSNTSLLI